MLNSLRDGQINYGTTNCPTTHGPPHNVVAPIHQNSLMSTEPSTPVVYPWNSTPRLEHLYGFHSRYYNLDYPTPYPPTTNQYVPTNMYGQSVPQCCQPCCRLRTQTVPKTSPQVLYNPIRPMQQLNRSYKSKKTLKTSCSEQFLPYIPNDLPVKYDTQNCYQQKYSSSYLNNTNYCPPANNNLWIPPAVNTTWPTDRLRPLGHTGVVSHDFNRDKNYQRLPNYQSNPYSNSSGATHHRPYNYIPPISDVHDFRPPIYHTSLKNNTSEYISHELNSRLPVSSQNNQSSPSLQQFYNAQSVPYSDIHRPVESFKPPQITPQNSSKSNLNVREFLATWDEGEEEISEKSSETTAPIVVLDCMTLEGDALSKVQEKLNVVSYENLEKVLKENQNSLVINTESNEIDSTQNKAKPPPKPNFEPLDYTKRETGIIRPFITEKKTSPEINSHSEKSYSVNFDGMVAWYGKKNTDISSTDLIERLADRIFNLSKSQENDGVSFGTAAYTGQITQTNRSIESSIKDSSKYIQSNHLFDLHRTEKCVSTNKIDCNNDSIPRMHSSVLNESIKPLTKSNNMNSSCIVENITKKCLNVTNEQTTPWNLDQGSQEHHLNMSLYDHSVIIKPLDFSSLTDKGNPFVFEKNSSSGDKPIDSINDQFNKVLNENNNYNSSVSNNQSSIQPIDSGNRNFPVIVSPHIHRQEYNGFHESVIQRTGCDKNKHDKVTTHTDFESINWNISNDLDKIMKNTNMAIEPPCLYDRNNYNILDSMNKSISTQWKDNIPCVDLTVNSKTNPNHDPFFDGWNFIENYDNHSSKKIIDPSNNNVVHSQLFPNQITALEEPINKKDNSSEKLENETLVAIKDTPFSKPNDLSSDTARSRDVFYLNRIPDFSDGFELSVLNEPQEYMQFKKSSNDNEHRTDGSIFEHLTEQSKCAKTINETTNTKNDQNKLDSVGLPSFKEKEPLAPMCSSVPPKLNIVKPILRDPSQVYTVIKQKLKHDITVVNNENIVSDKTGHSLRGNQTNIFNETSLKSKYDNVQLNQFDVWSEKFVLKDNTNNSSSSVVQCDVEITQFKSTPENRNSLIPKQNMSENYMDKETKSPTNTNCNLSVDKISVLENNKMSSNDFLNCLECTKNDDQKYRDTLDEFETSFGFDIHCNDESNKSFHEDIVDKCLEERIKDHIGEHNINVSDSNDALNSNLTPDNTRIPFQCDFQSGYLIKNYFDENKNKAVAIDREQTNNHEKSDMSVFNYHREMKHDFDLQNSENVLSIKDPEKDSDFNILNDVNHDIDQIQNSTEDKNSNFINMTKLKQSLMSNKKNTHIISSIEKNHFGYLSIENRNFEFENDKNDILESTNSKKKVIEINNATESNDICEIKHCSSNIHKTPLIQKHSSKNVDFESSIISTNIFKDNSNILNTEKNEINEYRDQKIDKNDFLNESFHSENAKSIEDQINHKSMFELGDNNDDKYQTQRLEKIHHFDFETKIIQNFEVECINNDDQEPLNQKKMFTNENKIKTKCNYEINDEVGKRVQNETSYKTTKLIRKETLIEESPGISNNNNIQFHNTIAIENINQENKTDRILDCERNEQRMFEVCCTNNNLKEKLNPVTLIDLNIQNEEPKNNNLNNCKNSHENSIMNNNTEVEKIFENICDNLELMNTEKNDINYIENRQNYNKCESSKSPKNTPNKNFKTINSKIVDKLSKKIKVDECHNSYDKTLEKTDNVLLKDMVNSEHLKEEKKKELEQVESILKKSDNHSPNQNENLFDISNKKIVCLSPISTTFEEHQIEDINQNEKESMNKNKIKTVKNIIIDTFQGDDTKKNIDKLKSDTINTIKDADKLQEEELCKNNNFSPYKLKCRLHSDEIVELENSPSAESNSLKYAGLTSQQRSNEIDVVIEKSPKSEPSSLNEVDLSRQPYFNEISDVKDALKNEPISLNNIELIRQEHSNGIFEVENSTNTVSNSINHIELARQLHSNDDVELKDSTSSEFISLNHDVAINNQHSNKFAEVESLLCPQNVFELSTNQNYSSEIAEDSTNLRSSVSSDNNVLQINDDSFLKNVDSKSVDENIKLPRVKFILKNHRKSLIKTNIFDEESIVPYKKISTVVNDDKFIVRNIFKKRNNFYTPRQCLYKRESINEPKENLNKVIEMASPLTTTNPIDIQQKNHLLGLNREEEKDYTVVSELISSKEEQFNTKLNIVDNKEINRSTEFDNTVFDGDSSELLPYEIHNTPMPSPFDDFQSENKTTSLGNEEYWDKSLEIEYKNVLFKAISKLAKNRINIRDKFDVRLLARKVNKTKQKKRRWLRRHCQRPEKSRQIAINNDLGGVKFDSDIATTVKVPTATIATNQMYKIKVQLPWGRIFNLNSHEANDSKKNKNMKLELGPAQVEVRLSRIPGDWQVAACQSMASPKSVVSVRRLVLQREVSPAKKYDGNDCSPVKDFDINCIPIKDCDNNCTPIKAYDDNCNPTKDYDNNSSPAKDYDVGNCSLTNKNYEYSSCSQTNEYLDSSCRPIEDDDNCSSNDMQQCSRKLPKIVIRRNGQDNNYTSYVSSGSGCKGGDNNDGTPQLIVRLVRDRKLDSMAANGVTTLHLKHLVPISESAAGTHGAKRVRYT